MHVNVGKVLFGNRLIYFVLSGSLYPYKLIDQAWKQAPEIPLRFVFPILIKRNLFRQID